MSDTIQFYLSRVAATAVDVDQLKFRARERGVPNATAETSYYKTDGRCRVTCRRAVARVLAEDLRSAMAAARIQAVKEECERGLTALEEAFRLADAPTHGPISDAARGILGT